MDSDDLSLPLRGCGNRYQLAHSTEIGDCSSIDEERRRQQQLTADTLDPVSATTPINIEPDRMSTEELRGDVNVVLNAD
jgi:hypothetical protein